MAEKTVICCPSCKRPVQAGELVDNPALVQLLGSVLPQIQCSCGYSGLPIELSLKSYMKWAAKKGKG